MGNTKVKGNENIFIQGVKDSTITLNINGETKEILKRLDVLQALLEQLGVSQIQSAGNNYNIQTIDQVNFSHLVRQAGVNNQLPSYVKKDSLLQKEAWVEALKNELIKQNVSVKGDVPEILQHYGWMIEVFLTKMMTETGQKRTPERLGFMAEAFQSSLKYLCFIQLAQLFRLEDAPKHPLITAYLKQDCDLEDNYDYLNLLITTTDLLKEETLFVPEISAFIEDLNDEEEDLYEVAIFLKKIRTQLLNGEYKIDDDINTLLDEYLMSLVFWLRRIAFVAKYRLVSMKNIHLDYKLGYTRNFVHLYGELHGIYDLSSAKGEYAQHAVEQHFTFNKSVLLFNNAVVQAGLDNIEASPPLSLSPLLIDRSVFSKRQTQTPEFYYYKGRQEKSYAYVNYRRELDYKKKVSKKRNEWLIVEKENDKEVKLNDLYEQLKKVFKPFR